jgi:hypothetical protein
MNGLMRRLDIDADSKVTFNEFSDALRPVIIKKKDRFSKIDKGDQAEVSEMKEGEKSMRKI